ncbi:MAG: hypothetical protein ACLRFM_00025 [Alphaproteobacteria bacterium]
MTGFNRFLFLLLVFTPAASIAAGTDFNMAAQLLSAARNGNTRLMQNLINSGADVNYVDSTGLSVVCTAVMNNDVRAVQVLQMYGADASGCDRQIKNYRARNNPTSDTGVFSGLSPTHKLVLGAVGVAGGIAGVLWATDAFGGDGGGDSGVATGGHGSNSGSSEDSGDTDGNIGFTVAAGYCQEGQCDAQFWRDLNGNGVYMTNNGINYLDVIGAYDAFARGYLGLTTWRGTNNAPIDLSNYTAPAGGKSPVLIAMVNKTGVNLGGSISSNIDIEYIQSCNGTVCTPGTIGKIYNNSDGASAVNFNLSSDPSVFGSATDSDTKLAKIISGYTSDVDLGPNDWVGVAPNSTLAIFKTGGQSVTKGYQNYEAMNNAARIGYTPAAVVNLENISGSELLDYYTLQSAKAVVASVQTANDKQTAYKNLIDNKYNTADLTSNTPGYYAGELFSYYQGTDYKWKPIVVMSAGNNNFSNYTIEEATFENYAPVVYPNMEHLFATTVAVAKNTNNNLISLTAWDTDSDNVVDTVSRKCGLAGKGDSGVDPWCFAAPGMNDLEAAATMAGAVGLLKGAFSYLSNEQIFILLAMTADGAYLGTNPSTGEPWEDGALESYLQGMYELPSGYDFTLDTFKDFFGYGVINLNRATTPGKSIHYFSDGKIVAANGNAYWRTAAVSKLRGSNVFGARGATIPVAAYDVVSSVDGAVSVMRQWNMDVALSGDASHGLYLGDTLAELKTRDVDNSVTVGNFKFGFARSEKFYDDNMSGVDNLSIAWDNDRFGFSSGYQHYLTDGAGRFSGMSNPVLALTSNAVSNAVELKSGRFGVSGRAFVGNITTDGLLENDPAISNNFAAAKLGDVMGAESGVAVRGEKLSIATNFGTMHETNTVLGARGYGFFDFGGADTNYIDSVIKYSVNDWAKLTLRGTYAWTRTGDVTGGVINGLSELKSNAFAAGVNLGNFDLTVSMPLALVSGAMRYSVADVALDDNGALIANNFSEHSIDLTPDVREYRLNASYRHQFGEWTDGALGFIYRVNPNNTDAFGNESIFMMKLSHRLGI